MIAVISLIFIRCLINNVIVIAVAEGMKLMDQCRGGEDFYWGLIQWALFSHFNC